MQKCWALSHLIIVFGLSYPCVTFVYCTMIMLYHFCSYSRETKLPQKLVRLPLEFLKQFTLSYINHEHINHIQGRDAKEFRIWPWTWYSFCLIYQSLLKHFLLSYHLCISTDIAGEWDMTSRPLKRGLRCTIWQKQKLKGNAGRIMDIFHLLVQVVPSCTLLKIKLTLLVLILAKKWKLPWGTFFWLCALKMSFQEAALKGSLPWGTNTFYLLYSFL